MKVVSRKSTKESIKYDGFQRVLERYGKRNNESYRPLDVKSICKVFQGPVEIRGKENIMFNLEQKKLLSKIVSMRLSTTFCSGCYEESKKNVLRSFESRGMCDKRGDENKGSFVVFVKIISDKTVIMLKSTSLVVCHVHGTL